MRIKEVAKRTGLTAKTIRYYDSVGLVVPDMEMKDHRVWRDYGEKHALLLSVVATLRRASFKVEEIALLLTSPEPDTAPEKAGHSPAGCDLRLSPAPPDAGSIGDPDAGRHRRPALGLPAAGQGAQSLADGGKACYNRYMPIRRQCCEGG